MAFDSEMIFTRRRSGVGLLALLALVVSAAVPIPSSYAAEKVRSYSCGEEDPDGDIGEEVIETIDETSPPTQDANGDPVEDGQGEFVSLLGAGGPTYVEGRDGEGSLAIDFDGVDDELTSPAFDPRNFGTFASLSQAWVRPDAAKQGTRQAVWSLGNDNGGVGITEDGKWEMIAVSIIQDTASDTDVAFDEWTHLAVLRGGNGAELYVNGALVASGANFWNGIGQVSVGRRTAGDPFYFDGAIDDFNIAGFSDFDFDAFRDIDFFGGGASDVVGDVNQDGVVDDVDYGIWAENVGFDNELGGGDGNTLLMGDVDQNGRVNYFDFQVIAAAADVPIAPALDDSGVVAVDDFLNRQPTKALGPGGGFNFQNYDGGRGTWTAPWVSVGNGIITGADFEPRERRFMALTTTGLSANNLSRGFSVEGLPEDETLYFAARFLIPEGGSPPGSLILNPAGEEFQEISIAVDPATGFSITLGEMIEFSFDPIEIETNVLHQIVGKLEFNSAGANEVLSAWLNPEDLEDGEFELITESDVVNGLEDLVGTLTLDRGTQGGGALFWDDVAIGTSWEAVTNVDISRLALRVNAETGAVSLVNGTPDDVELKYYEIASEGGSLSVDGWSSLAEGGVDGWAVNSPTANLLTESNFTGGTTIAAGGSIDLGMLYQTDKPQDLVARYATTQLLFNAARLDRDEDGVFDTVDNCAATPNADQADADDDGLGDVCDNCPEASNRDQVDLDEDGVGNACDDEVADTYRDWSPTGSQGENNMYYGYFDVTQDLADGGDGVYAAEKLTLFLNDESNIISGDAALWRESPNHWNGNAWDITSAGAPPWTFLGRLDLHPNDPDPEAEHWVVRRWESDRSGNISILWHMHHENVACGGNGVGGLLYHNDTLVDEAAVSSPFEPAVTRTVELTVGRGDTIDLVLNAIGPNGMNEDDCDGSQNWFLVTSTDAEPTFNRGDVNGQGATPVDIADAIGLLNHLFGDAPPPICEDSADANDDGAINIADAIGILNFLFSADGREPLDPGPFRPCGSDPTPDELGCAEYLNCE